MAISKIGSKALVDCSVAAVDIADNSITAAKLAGSIANAKLTNSSITVNGNTVALGASTSIPAVQWQSVITADGSTATSAVAGQGYFIDTTSNAHTINLPGSPSAGDTIAIKDYAGTFGTNNLTIGRNGNNIQGVANNSLIDTNRASLTLVYVDATKGWLYAVESNVADLQEALFITATGGTVTTSGDFKIHTFTGDGCFVVSCAGGVGSGPSTVDYLVVAGGGGGGKGRGGGGGAGGYRESHSTCNSGCYTASPLATPTGITVTATTYPVTVGGGGTSIPQGPNALQPEPTAGHSGSNSVFATITSTGGGAGSSNVPSCGGASGGSGGGSAGQGNPGGGTGNTPPTSPPQGNAGGWGASGPNPVGAKPGGSEFGAGGGGAGATGNPGAQTPGYGDGGTGVGTAINPAVGTPGPNGALKYFAGGGGGGGNYDAPFENGIGGTGGGGGGGAVPGPGNGSATAPSGTTNTGGGGGGSAGVSPNCQPIGASGAGGSGIVVIRYKFQ